MGLKIKLLGDPLIIGEDGLRRIVRGYQSWALLVRVILAPKPLERASLAMELFPETVDPLGSLRWCLAALRKALGASNCLVGDPIETNFPADFEIDVLQVDRGDFRVEEAGPLLGAIEPRCSPEFSTWLLVERQRIAGLIEARLRQDTMRAISIEDFDGAIRLAQMCVRGDPFAESAHILLVKSLALAGRYDAALAHVEATESVFLTELGEMPSQALRSAARRTISSAPGGISPEAFVNSLIQSGLAALSAGAADAGIDCLRRAANDAEKISGRHLQAKAMLELGTALVHSVRGYDDEGAILLRQSTELAQQSGSSAIAAAGFRELGYVEALAGRRPAAASYLASAIDLVTDGESLAGIHAVIGFNLVDWGQVGEGLEHFGVSLDHARAAGSRRREIWSLGLGARGLLAADRLDEADTWLESCLKLSEEQRWMAFRPWPVALLSESKVRQKHRPALLRGQLEEAFAMSCQLGDPCWEAAVARAMALTYAATDELSTAMDWLTEARRRCIRNSDAYMALQVEILASQVDISMRQGNQELSDTFARQWVSLAARTHMNAHVARAAAFIGGHQPASFRA
ncbi:AfsR/SARP family transcriptional regulator [Bosea sp. PAMC 26642]|uniref:AfsR/SARP family transcriptional regulator n=1 Tax=Bosea sp. (strain PAMC 26642) TaxID=1792307 RepID=UPI000B29F4C5|nr:BTAD domain-containing putative transcriptional regulator [Bosea sp. PAMC 26642]